ncbi:MAG: TetR/AcrR family transcriptional regulator [Gammaproteobacteria bacterium]|nr:TetR/AcrR family transcriptional regulator [Gammaproteobacteria bacterium]
MKKSKIDKRSRLIEAADKLVQQQGFNQTTLADIAQESKVPLGNVYYYFKTKDDIGHALIEHRTQCILHGQFSQWDKLSDPRKRILAAIKAVADNREILAQSGCPIGSLCQELHKEGGPLADKAAGMFSVLLEWLDAQFHLLGMGKASSDHALHLLAALQGASLLTNAFNDPTLMLREATRLKQWVTSL